MGIRYADHVTPLYPQKLALTSPTGGGRSVGIVRSRTKATEFSFSLCYVVRPCRFASDCQHFGRTGCLIVHGRGTSEAVDSFETWGTMCNITRCPNPEEHNQNFLYFCTYWGTSDIIRARYLRFVQQCCRGSSSSRMWRSATRLVFPDILKNRRAVIFEWSTGPRKNINYSSWTPLPFQYKGATFLRNVGVPTQRHNVIS